MLNLFTQYVYNCYKLISRRVKKFIFQTRLTLIITRHYLERKI